MPTLRETYADGHVQASVDPIVLATDPGREWEPGDTIESLWIERDAIRRGAEPNAYLVRSAYGRDALGRDLVSEVNYAVLIEEYGDYLATVSWQNVDQVCILADTDVPDDLIDVLDGLERYPVLDDGMLSDLEQACQEEDWEDYGRRSLRRELGAELSDELEDEVIDAAYWDHVGECGEYPYREIDEGTIFPCYVEVAAELVKRYE